MRPRFPLRQTALVLAVVALGATFPVHAGAQKSCSAPSQALEFAKPTYVDTGRAGGEPVVQTHPDGTLIYTAHAGTTHFYSPAAGDPNSAAFAQHYTGQTYVWVSDNDGKKWTFVDRTVPTSGLAGSGFSDPDL